LRGFATATKRKPKAVPAITLVRVDDNKNMRRFYKFDVQSTLFGEWSFVREWGRIGRAGTVRVETYRTRGNADMAMAYSWMRKLKRGYR
jgi:predicted DNA-binding WGR domain protein